MPVSSKQVVITTSTSVDKAKVVLLNRSTGDIWHGTIDVDTCIIDIGNNNIWGDEATQWVNGHVLEIVVFAETKGGATVTVADITEVSVTMATDNTIEIVV